jgi:hypothetical protein
VPDPPAELIAAGPWPRRTALKLQLTIMAPATRLAFTILATG